MDSPLTVISMAQERLGPIRVVLSSRGVVGLHMKADEADVQRAYPGRTLVESAERHATIPEQLAAYFNGSGRQFDIAIDWSAFTPFQEQVLKLVCEIKFGQTSTYQDIARQLGKPGAARAVGRANATNPIPIIIPCHRVLGADGSLQGYGGPGGVETKAWLLRLEGSRLL